MTRVKVYRLAFNVDRYQSLALDGDDELFAEWAPRLEFDGTSRAAAWKPPPLWIPQPRLRQPDIWDFPVSAAAAFGARAVEALEGHLARAGETLPLPVADEMELTLLNVLQDIDCLDKANSTFLVDDIPERYSFVMHRLPESTVFKIPQTDGAEILCHEGYVPKEDGFRYAVESGGFEGLVFTELWDSEEGPREPDWNWP